MTTKCADCEKGPAGQGGHDNLFSHSFVGGNVLMKCRACGTCWTRVSEGNDVYRWMLASATQGSLLPTGGVS